MHTTLIKLFSLFKNHGGKIATIVSIVIAVFGGIQSCRANKAEAEAQRLDGKLQEQVADQDRYFGEAAKARASRRVKETKERGKRKDLEARIEKFQKDTVAGKRALKAEKAKTTLLPPSELVQEVATYIGDELTLTGERLYLFTRTGTERTLDRFKDGDFYLSEYNKFQGVIADHETEVESFNTSIGECEEAVATNLTGWDGCREALATAQDDIVAQKKVAKGSVWRGRKQGAFWTIIVVGGLKLFGVW